MSETGIIIVEIPDPPTGNAVGDNADSQSGATDGSGETSAAPAAQSDEDSES